VGWIGGVETTYVEPCISRIDDLNIYEQDVEGPSLLTL
jgi:hypothetical protein